MKTVVAKSSSKKIADQHKMELFDEDSLKMFLYENRLKTFEGWPFDEDCTCTPENVSIFCPAVS